MSKYIDIVFDGPPGPCSGRFVEVENDLGESISIGEWIDRGEGLWALRIPVDGVQNVNVVPSCVLMDEEAVKSAFDQMMAGANRQPCFVCGKKVKAEYCFCHLCGLVFCDVHHRQHRPGGLT